MAKWKKGGRGRPPNKVRLKGIKATTTTPDQEVSGRARFEKTATGRMNRAIGAIHMIGNLASHNYDWKPEDVKLMRQHLIEAVDRTFERFQPVKVPERSGFAFESKSAN
jgi:hypothetical protein